MIDKLRNSWRVLTIITVSILVIIGVWHLVTYRKTLSVYINSRYWTWESSIKYDTTSTRVECETNQSCTGFGDSKTCTTKTDCRPVTHTTTHTRCRNVSRSETQPPLRPTLCAMQHGDYISDNLVYHIAYRVSESDKTGKATFDGADWNALSPDTTVKITLNALDRIVKVE